MYYWHHTESGRRHTLGITDITSDVDGDSLCMTGITLEVGGDMVFVGGDMEYVGYM